MISRPMYLDERTVITTTLELNSHEDPYTNMLQRRLAQLTEENRIEAPPKHLRANRYQLQEKADCH